MSGDEEVFGLRFVDPVPIPREPRDERDWVAEGSHWRVWRSGDVLMLQYQSGEHGGGTRSIAIEPQDLADLQDGSATCDDILHRHHAS